MSKLNLSCHCPAVQNISAHIHNVHSKLSPSSPHPFPTIHPNSVTANNSLNNWSAIHWAKDGTLSPSIAFKLGISSKFHFLPITKQSQQTFRSLVLNHNHNHNPHTDSWLRNLPATLGYSSLYTQSSAHSWSWFRGMFRPVLVIAFNVQPNFRHSCCTKQGCGVVRWCLEM